jgi:hypothetical protein
MVHNEAQEQLCTFTFNQLTLDTSAGLNHSYIFTCTPIAGQWLGKQVYATIE